MENAMQSMGDIVNKVDTLCQRVEGVESTIAQFPRNSGADSSEMLRTRELLLQQQRHSEILMGNLISLDKIITSRPNRK